MINKDSFIADTLKRLEKLEVGKCLDIRTFKKDRKVVIEKLAVNYNVYEEGFEKQSFMNLEVQDMKKLLKTLEKREFPRSNKLRVYVVDAKEAGRVTY